MRNAAVALALLLLSGAAAGRPLSADPPPPPGPPAPRRPAGPPGRAVTVLDLSATASESAVPERLRIVMRAEQNGSDPRAVQAAINRQMTAAVASLRAARGVTTESGPYQLSQFGTPAGPQHWRGSQSLTLSGNAAALLLQLAGSLQGQGLVMSSLGWQVSPAQLRGAENKLTISALADLARRAALIAGQVHLRVLGYRQLTAGNAEAATPPIYGPVLAARAMPTPAAVPGRTRIRLTVTAKLLLGH